MQLFAGALLERPPGPKYTEALDFAELALTGPLPKPQTLTKWRTSLPEGFRLALRVPRSCWTTSSGPLRPGEEMDAGLAWLSSAVESLAPELLVLATSSDVTTGARDRQRLRDYVARLPRPDGVAVAWRASGLWEQDSVERLARDLDVLPGFDPVDDAPPAGTVIYGSLVAEGLRRSFSHALLLDVIDSVASSSAEVVYVTIDSPQSFREAKLLHSLAEGGE